VITLDFVLRQGDFRVEIHERVSARITALFGPSGSGKTTVLDAIAGLRTPASGQIAIGSRALFECGTVNLPSHQRHVGYVTQDVALFPHMNVRRNILYGRRRGQKLVLETVASMLEVTPLIDREISTLSGGERQRVALARALMSAPDLLLLDEPLAAVDLELRTRILPYLERVRDELGVPILYVTHDRGEVHRFAEQVIVLNRGSVIRSGDPLTALGAAAAVTRQSGETRTTNHGPHP
jgi:molybdate transport system ATP-binding protein